MVLLVATLLLAAPLSGAEPPRTILDLQPSAVTTRRSIEADDGHRGVATLVNLNPAVNAWLVLTLAWDDADEPETYHLELPEPAKVQVTLDPRSPRGVWLDAEGRSFACPLWGGSPDTPLVRAREFAMPYAPLCGGRVYLRNSTRGHKTSLEKVTDLLRRHVPGGEALTGFVREEFFKDKFAETTPAERGTPSSRALVADDDSLQPGHVAPPPAHLARERTDDVLWARSLGIEPEGAPDLRLPAGRWVPAAGVPGVFVSVMKPALIHPDQLASTPLLVNALDPVEKNALVYLVAFDLERHGMGFALGTEHPALGWSERIPARLLDTSRAGPDGIDTSAPLVRTGMLNPADAARVVATFSGGFKRYHGAFKSGDLAFKNDGSHYGFVEDGVVFSRMIPGLATAIVTVDGQVELKTWDPDDALRLGSIRFARQNGVMVAERNTSGVVVPGRLVRHWIPGNWSGNASQSLRTVRGALALMERGGHRFLVFAYFSAATPSAMVRVFQSYGVTYAMMLDINALEHTYLAVYRNDASAIRVQCLVRGMEEKDGESDDGKLVPRFVGKPDNRDFFYLLAREPR